MLQRMVMILLIGFVATGFSWGSAESKDEESTDKKNTYYGTSSSTSTNRSAQSSSQKSPKAKAAKTSSAGTRAAQTTQVTTAPQKFPVQLISNLASGDEETRKARLESLKRLSAAMSQMNSRQAAAESAR